MSRAGLLLQLLPVEKRGKRPGLKSHHNHKRKKRLRSRVGQQHRLVPEDFRRHEQQRKALVQHWNACAEVILRSLRSQVLAVTAFRDRQQLSWQQTWGTWCILTASYHLSSSISRSSGNQFGAVPLLSRCTFNYTLRVHCNIGCNIYHPPCPLPHKLFPSTDAFFKIWSSWRKQFCVKR